jgi:uncharacterized protein involved in outer membrane biogenesis
MKIIKIALITFVSLLALIIVAVIVLVMTFDINRYKPQIIKEANKVLNRQIDFSNAGLRLSLRNGVIVQVSDLVIGDDPRVHAGDLLTAKKISLAVDVLGYIFDKEVNVSCVAIDSAHVTVIRQKDGSLNVDNIARTSGNTIKDETQGNSQTPVPLPVSLASSFTMRNCMVSYIDHSTSPFQEIDVTDVDISVKEISLAEPFRFTIDGSVLSARQNIHVEGMLRIDLDQSEFTLNEWETTTDLSDIILEKLPSAFPAIDSGVVPERLSGNVACGVEHVIVGEQGISSFVSKVTLCNGAVLLDAIGCPIDNIELFTEISPTSVVLNNMSADIGGGVIAATGTIDDYAANQVYTMKLNATGIKLQELLARDATPAQAEGIIAGSV